MASSNATMSGLDAEHPLLSLMKANVVKELKQHRAIRNQFTGVPHHKRDYSVEIRTLQNPRAPTKPFAPTVPDLVHVEDPYPPCVHGLADLKPMLISELTGNTHHRGRLLLAKLVGVSRMGRKDTIAATEDVSGDFEYLYVHFVCMNK
jgi:hypothetical protein